MLLITGITGHSGVYLLRELIKNNYQGNIKCIVRENSEVSLVKQSGLNIELYYGDLTDQLFLDEVFDGVDTVLHIASIFFSEYVMKSAIKKNVKRAIFVHTTGVYSKYKSAAEEYLQIEQNIKEMIKSSSSSISLVYLRPTMIYGNINDRNMIVFIKMVDKLRIFPVIDHGSNYLQPVNGRDLGVGYYQLLMKSEIVQGDYILSGSESITMLNLFRMISNLLGKKTLFVNIPMLVGVTGALLLKACSLGKVDYIEKVKRMGEDRHFSHEDARRDFDYEPMKLSDGLMHEIQEYLKHKNGKLRG